jgi:hypothetical protein
MLPIPIPIDVHDSFSRVETWGPSTFVSVSLVRNDLSSYITQVYIKKSILPTLSVHDHLAVKPLCYPSKDDEATTTITTTTTNNSIISSSRTAIGRGGVVLVRAEAASSSSQPPTNALSFPGHTSSQTFP